MKFYKVILLFIFQRRQLLAKMKNKKIFKFLGESKAVIVDQKDILNQKTKKQYLILGFEKTVIIIEKASTSILRTIFPNKNNIATFYISESIHTDQMISLDSTFLEEIQSFNDKFIIIKQPKEINEIWSIIVSCISGYL
ncbi:hypothetical protein M9Y10_031382 [Tritrichomonas musculus]|uniref:Uncharacterized protein n=1 Tax=Tritrichomonas musculus TaxID=1915356 RepID=A0ABR2H0G2_9EUKA